MAAGENLDRLPLVPSGDTGLWSDLAPGAKWPTDQPPFVTAWDLANNEPAAVPRDLICTDFSRGAAAEAAPILRHSIGLGAGATLGAALMHGLLECIETDARIRCEFSGRADRVALDETHLVYGPLLCRLAELGMRVVVRNLSCSDCACVIHASVMEAPGASALPLPASGYAARACPHAAIAAALAEAVQARLAVISGAREDITQRLYAHGYSRIELEAEWARHGPGAAEPIEEELARHLSVRDLASQVGSAFAVPLFWDSDLPLAITRVIAPGLIADPQRIAAQP